MERNLEVNLKVGDKVKNIEGCYFFSKFEGIITKIIKASNSRYYAEVNDDFYFPLRLLTKITHLNGL